MDKRVNSKIDIFVISAYVSDEVSEEAMKLGATDYAVKPLDLRVISLKNFQPFLVKTSVSSS